MKCPFCNNEVVIENGMEIFPGHDAPNLAPLDNCPGSFAQLGQIFALRKYDDGAKFDLNDDGISETEKK